MLEVTIWYRRDRESNWRSFDRKSSVLSFLAELLKFYYCSHKKRPKRSLLHGNRL